MGLKSTSCKTSERNSLLKKGNLFSDREGLMFAIQDQIMNTTNYKKHMVTDQNTARDWCHLCNVHVETVNNLIKKKINKLFGLLIGKSYPVKFVNKLLFNGANLVRDRDYDLPLGRTSIFNIWLPAWYFKNIFPFRLYNSKNHCRSETGRRSIATKSDKSLFFRLKDTTPLHNLAWLWTFLHRDDW